MNAKLNHKKFETPLDTFFLVERIGSGGNGIVYKVKDGRGENFAVKCLNPERFTRDKVKRFKNELNFGLYFQHKNIIKVLDWGFRESKGKKYPFYIMPYYEKTLKDLNMAGISREKILPYFSQILDGVEAAHLKNTWHRDLKPENILFDTSSETLVIADFGIAHFTKDLLLTLIETDRHDKLANFLYAAPEQKIKKEEVDHKADIFALGMILNEMFTGTPPLGTDFRKIESVDSNYAYLDGIIDKMMKQSSEQRISPIDKIKQELIARQNAFISRQKLSKLKETVVPNGEIDDPLVENPIKVVDKDYRNDNLILKLNQPVNSVWINCFESIGGSLFTFRGSEASIQSGESNVQNYVNMFNDKLIRANREYRYCRQEEQERKQKHDERILQERIAEEEKRQRVLDKIKI